jgi:leader peptidase (prepilin peptidase)/N-methyltransferase
LTPDTFVTLVLAAIGLVMGSAVSALAWRLPRGASWVHGRSACTACGHVLGPRDLVPLLSWALARGRCRYCGAPVSLRYPLNELVSAAWSVGAWWVTGWSPMLPLVLVWGWMLLALLWIDLDFQLLPDALTFPGTLIAIAAAALGPGGRHALFGVLMGAGLLWLVAEVYFRIRRIEGMGGGDVKLAAMFGALLGPWGALLTIFLAALAGSLWGAVLMARGQGDGRTALPFGTVLCPAAMAVYLVGDPLVSAWLGLLRP